MFLWPIVVCVSIVAKEDMSTLMNSMACGYYGHYLYGPIYLFTILFYPLKLFQDL